MDLLERQQRAREATLWVDKDSGLGMLLAKRPAYLFAHVRQAADTLYMDLLRKDRAGGRDHDTVRIPAQRIADVVCRLLLDRDAETGEMVTRTVGVRAKGSTQTDNRHSGRCGGRHRSGRAMRDHRGRPRTSRDTQDPHPRHRVPRRRNSQSAAWRVPYPRPGTCLQGMGNSNDRGWGCSVIVNRGVAMDTQGYYGSQVHTCGRR